MTLITLVKHQIMDEIAEAKVDSKNMKNSLVRNSNMWLCDTLEAFLQSAEEERERGRLVNSIEEE